jgi:hypothetical protein
MPGFTHLQVAQPVTLGHHLMAYYEMIARDRSRFADARAAGRSLPIGGGGAGGHRASRSTATRPPGRWALPGPTANSLDSVSDRDFALDYLMAATQCALHLSRLAEEFVIWASQPFGFVALSDAWSTGSSIMPQKRNPDAAELVRGHSGRIAGCMTALVMTMKGLPLAYSKDMQDDKPPVFEAHDLLALSIAAMTGMVESVTFRTDRMRAAAEAGYSTATDLADWLVRVADVPFREAHHITGRTVRMAEERACALDALPLADLQAIDARIDARVFDALSVDASVASRASHGGTAPARCARRWRGRARRWREKLMRRAAAMMLVGALALGACGRRDALVPAAGTSLPVKPQQARVQPTVDDLLRRRRPRAVAQRRDPASFRRAARRSLRPAAGRLSAMNHFDVRDGVMHAEGVPLPQIADAVGTPVYVYSTATIERHVRVFQEGLAAVESGPEGPLIAFAVKANPNGAVLATLARMGLGADVVSRASCCARWPQECRPKRSCSQGSARPPRRCGSRWSAGSASSTWRASRGRDAVRGRRGDGRDRPRGVPDQPGRRCRDPRQDLDRPLRQQVRHSLCDRGARLCPAAELPGLAVQGVAVHIGSQLTDLAPLKSAFARIGELIASLRGQGHRITTADLGGGLGVPYDTAFRRPPTRQTMARWLPRRRAAGTCG